MNHRCLASLGLAALAIGMVAALVVPMPIVAQAQSSQARPAAAAPATSQARPAAAAPAKAWTAKTPDGHPDLQGYWTNNSYTPLQRPANTTKEFYTKEELVVVEKQRAATEAEQTVPGTTGDVHYDFSQFALDRSQTRLTGNLRTSVIVDPPNGQLPARVGAAAGGGAAGGRGGGGAGAGAGAGGRGGGAPAAAAAPAAAGAPRGGAPGAAAAAPAGGRGAGAAPAAAGGGRGNTTYDQVQNIAIGSRCIWAGNTGPPMMPPGYNPAYQIIQSKDAVMILIENQHEIRVVALNRTTHPPEGVRMWLGDSIGRYEGNTLVVETTNFNARAVANQASQDMKVTERFTRLDEDTIRYEFTVDDPKTWVQPWKGEMPFVKINGPIFEHACHEGNFGIANTLAAYRLEEKKAAEAAAGAKK